MDHLRRLKPVAVSLLTLVVLYLAGDNVLYLGQHSQQEQLLVNFRHAAYIDVTSPAPPNYRAISDDTLYREPVRFRTGAWGQVLPVGGTGSCQVVFLGGSTTESHWMPEDERWPFLIGEHPSYRRRIQTYNFGAGGQNLHQSLAKYLLVIGELRPRIVVVTHQVNDLGKLLNGGYYASEGGGLYDSYQRQPVGLPVGERLRQMMAAALPMTYDVWRNARNAAADPRLTRLPDQTHREVVTLRFNTYFSRLLALRALVEAEGGTLVLIHQPNRTAQLLAPGYDSTSSRDLRALLKTRRLEPDEYIRLLQQFSDEMRSFAARESVAFIDARSEFPTDPAYFYDAIHFSVAGSRAFAAYVATHLRSTIDSHCQPSRP